MYNGKFALCGSLNVIGPCNLIENGAIMRSDFVEMVMALWRKCVTMGVEYFL